MVTDAPALNYSRGNPGPIQRAQRLQIFSVIILVIGLLTIADVAWLEILNLRAGSLLPLAPLAPDARHTWRMASSREDFWRRRALNPQTDPLWESRPLTPTEHAAYEQFRIRNNAEANLSEGIVSTCLLYPIVGALLFCIPVLIWRHSSPRWRLALGLLFLAQIGVITVMYLHSYGDALGRAID